MQEENVFKSAISSHQLPLDLCQGKKPSWHKLYKHDKCSSEIFVHLQSTCEQLLLLQFFLESEYTAESAQQTQVNLLKFRAQRISFTNAQIL